MDKYLLLKSVTVFSRIEESLIRELASQFKEAGFKAGSEIFRENVPADSFFIIDSGEIIISKEIGTDKEKILAVLGPGGVFGEMAFFSDSPRTAKASVRTDSILWKIDRNDFINFISRQPEAGLSILSGLLQLAMDRLERTSRELATIYDTGKIISSGKFLAEVSKEIREEILLAVSEANDAAIFLYNEFNQEYDPAAAPAGTVEISPDSPLVALAKENVCGVILDSPEKINSIKNGLLKDAQSILLAPILKGNKLLGLILLWNMREDKVFRNSHCLLVSAVGSQLAEAVENIRHQQEERDRQRLKDSKQQY